MKEIIKQSHEMNTQLISWRRTLHENPEIGMELPKTVEFVKQQLIEMGYSPTDLGGGVVATIGSGDKCVLLRADMDALPMKEETDLTFRSKNGCMHACGHDLHTTMLLGAAKLLKQNESLLKGQVKLMFQPGEEVFQGAKAMLNAGVLESPSVNAAIMFHVIVGTPLPAGTIVISNPGITSAASDAFVITVKGKGGHGAMPDSTVDPINVLCHIYMGLETIISREISASDAAVVTVGKFNAGTANNIIPDTASMSGTIRTFDKNVRNFIIKRMEDIATSTATAYRATVQCKFETGCTILMNDSNVVHDIREILSDNFGQAVLPPIPEGGKKLSGSEDFSFVSEQVPSLMMALSAGSIQEGYEKPMHHPMAIFNEDIMSQGAAAYAISAIGWLNKN